MCLNEHLVVQSDTENLIYLLRTIHWSHVIPAKFGENQSWYFKKE